MSDELRYFNPPETPMCDEGVSHDRNGQYSYKMPSPPRIIVPPPQQQEMDEFNRLIGSPVFNPDPSLNVDFLRNIDFSRALSGIRFPSWAYKNRREAQSVLSFLYIGPISAAKDKEYLRNEGITMILGVQPRSPFGKLLTAGPLKTADELNIAKEVVEFGDLNDLIRLFPVTTKLINRHLAWMNQVARTNPTLNISPAKVLVFCESGNEKSAAVLAAYLMETFENIDHIRAMQILTARRFSINFDEVVKNMLLSYCAILLARREVQGGQHQNPHNNVSQHISYGSSAVRKRIRDMGSDEEMYDGDRPSVEQHDGREQRAPFR